MKTIILKALSITIFVHFFAGCSTTLQNNTDTVTITDSSSYFDLPNSTIPLEYQTLLNNASQIVRERFSEPDFLFMISSKQNYTFAPATEGFNGSFVEQSIVTKKIQGTQKISQPKLMFYEPPIIGWDECNGFSFLNIITTSSTGCTNGDGFIRKNINAIPQNSTELAAFLAHEWLHTAGYNHGGNSNQCSKKKRNSVPIYVGCLIEAYPDINKIENCEQVCSNI